MPEVAQGLRCVIQSGWRSVDWAGLLGLIDEHPQELEDRSEVLTVARQATEVDGLAFMAIRFRAEHAVADVLTVALPPEGSSRPSDEREVSEAAQQPAVLPPNSGFVELSSGPALVHDDSDTALDGKLTVIQLVTRIPPERRGAVVTAISSERGCQELLLQDAAALAESLRMESLQVPDQKERI